MIPAPLKIAITCYPSVGGSGILATSLGQELAERGHEIHFISHERPFRLKPDPRIHFHPVTVNEYGLFKYPDYTLPLSVKMSEVARDVGLDILHVHYAVPHATAAILARDMLRADHARHIPKIVTTLHGTDTTLLGQDPGYGPAIEHALSESDAVTAVSHWLSRETLRLLPIRRRIDVIHNFFTPRPARRTKGQVRAELGLREGEALLLHISNLRPVKRVDLLLESVARIPGDVAFKLLILAGEDFAPFLPHVRRLGLESRVIVRDKVMDVEDYLQAADVGLYTSESESFCLGILEGMFFGSPGVAMSVGGVPEVIGAGESGVLVPFGDTGAFAAAVTSLLRSPEARSRLGEGARRSARERFSAAAIVPQYESLYGLLSEHHYVI